MDGADNVMPESQRISLHSLQVLLLVHCTVVKAVNPSLNYFLQVRCRELVNYMLYTNIDDMWEAHDSLVLRIKLQRELMRNEECF